MLCCRVEGGDEFLVNRNESMSYVTMFCLQRMKNCDADRSMLRRRSTS